MPLLSTVKGLSQSSCGFGGGGTNAGAFALALGFADTTGAVTTGSAVFATTADPGGLIPIPIADSVVSGVVDDAPSELSPRVCIHRRPKNAQPPTRSRPATPIKIRPI